MVAVLPPPDGSAVSESILEVRALNKRFGAVCAAQDIDVGIAKDSIVGLIGANGAGKTTFINIVTGYLKPDSGRVAYAGRDITGLAPRAIARLGISRSFQIPQLYGSMTVFENVMVGLGIILRNAGLGGFLSRARPRVPGHDAPEEEVAERLLASFGLLAYRNEQASKLAGGLRKLLDIALSMIPGPRILLLDEPTSGVSAEEKFEIMEMIIRAVRKEGATVLFVEHDMEVVGRSAQRVLAFYDGRIIADGEPSAVLDDADVRRFVVGVTPQAR
jgi:branched-chain amino acid transport system ATP-binding protein